VHQINLAKRDDRCLPPYRSRPANVAAGYTAALGTEVRTDEVQATVLALQHKNLIRRMGHGSYSITDPFVNLVWLEREASGIEAGEFRRHVNLIS
jgi:hypothetical protein